MIHSIRKNQRGSWDVYLVDTNSNLLVKSGLEFYEAVELCRLLNGGNRR